MPAGLQQALINVAELASEEAHEQILELAGDQQLTLFRQRDTSLGPYDLAFKLYLDHGDLFNATRARVRSRQARRYVDFFAQGPASAPEEPVTEAKRVAIQSRLARWFGSRNRTQYCDLRILNKEEEVVFLVVHGRPPRNLNVIESDVSRSRITFVPDKQDTVVFHEASGRLSVNAQWPLEQDFYRRLFGQVLFGTPEHFGAREIYSGAPLIELGQQALSAAGIRGLRRVALEQVEFLRKDSAKDRIRWEGPDLGTQLSTSAIQQLMTACEIRHLKLGLWLGARSRRLPVVIEPPNRLTYDRHLGGGIVREFLLARGFMRLPDREDPCPTASA